MKKIAQLLLLGLAMLVSTASVAQEWFPVGATWTYSVFYPFGYGDPSSEGEHPKVYTCDRDTLIRGVNAKIIKGGTMCSCAYYDENIFYHNSEEDVVYIYIEDQFRTYADFSKKIGETYNMHYYNNESYSESKCEYITFKVDSIKIENISGKDLRCQYLSAIKNRGNVGVNARIVKVIESIGYTFGFYPDGGACDFEVNGWRGLRCYQYGDIGYHTDSIFEENGCDYIIRKTGVKDVVSATDFKVYPNPAKDYIQISLHNEFQNRRVDIYDVIGGLKKSVVISDGFAQDVIDISDLGQGVYVVKLTANDKLIGTEKLLKK